MAVTGFWYLRQASDDEVLTARPSIDAFVDRVERDGGIQEVMAAWRSWPAQIYGFDDGHRLDRLNRLFLGTFLAATPDQETFYAFSRDDIDEATWDVGRDLQPVSCQAAFVHTDRFPPMSLLFVGLGPDRVAGLPGAIGNFALTAGELVAAADRMRRAHALAPAERVDAINRMKTWLELGGLHSFDAGHVLDAIPALLGPALTAGKGLVSVTATA